MKRLLASFTAISSIALAVLIVPHADAKGVHHNYRSVQWYNQATAIADRWENDRPAVQSRVRDNYTDNDSGEFDEKSHDANITLIGSKLVPCIRDVSTCKAKNKFNQKTDVK